MKEEKDHEFLERLEKEKVLETEKSFVIQDENRKILCVDEKTFTPKFLIPNEVTFNNLLVFTQGDDKTMTLEKSVSMFLSFRDSFRTTKPVENLNKEKAKLLKVEYDSKRRTFEIFLPQIKSKETVKE